MSRGSCADELMSGPVTKPVQHGAKRGREHRYGAKADCRHMAR